MKKTMIEDNPLVSVIIPTYNRRDTIVRSINSIIDQTYNNIEIIIVDDGSDDGTSELINSMTDERIVFIHCKKNRGVAQARNIGVEASHGEFIAFNDSDDVWKINKLEKQIQVLCKNKNAHLCYCPYVLHKGDELVQYPDLENVNWDLDGNIYESLLKTNWIGTPTIVVSREAFIRVGGFNGKLRALDDWELVIKISRLYEIIFLNEVLVDAYYTQNSITAGSDKFFHNTLAIIEIIKENRKWNKNTNNFFDLHYVLLYYLSNLPQEQLSICRERAVPFVYNDTFIFDKILEGYMVIINNKKTKEKLRVALELLNKNKCIEKLKIYLESLDIKTVAVYGYGDVGKILIDYLLEVGIKISYIVDKNADQVINYCIYKPEDNLPCVDMMVVSIIDDLYTITGLMEKKIKTRVERLQDII